MDHSEIKKISELFIQKSLESPTPDHFEQREIFELVKNREDSIVIGLRRIGKTTLLEQIVKQESTSKIKEINNQPIEDLKITLDTEFGSDMEMEVSEIKIQDQDKLNKILFLKMDSLEFITKDEEQLIQVAISIRNYIVENDIKIVLIDEIQVIPQWSYFLKDIKDIKNDVWIMCTGSNSNALIKSLEHGVGRFIPKFYGILSLREFFNIKSADNQLKIEELTDTKLLNEYINFNHFPNYDEDDYFREVPSAVIEKSFGASKKDKTLLLKLMKWLSNNPGSEINTQNIARDIEITRYYINEYLNILEEGQLIFQLQNSKLLNKHKKVYSLIPGIFRLFDLNESFEKMTEDKQGNHFENFVFIQLLSLTKDFANRWNWNFIRDRTIKYGKNEIDFVYNSVGFEVKRTFREEYINDYKNVAIKNGVKVLYFIYLEGDEQISNRKISSENNEIEIRFIKWYKLGNEKTIKELKEALNVR